VHYISFNSDGNYTNDRNYVVCHGREVYDGGEESVHCCITVRTSSTTASNLGHVIILMP
jgi:hypothetical protein